MAADSLQYAIGNSASTTLSSGLANDGTSAPLTSDTNFNAKTGEGMVVISEGENVEEYAYATTKAGGALTVPLANRGLEGGSAQTHASGASVKGIITAGMWNNVIDALTNLVAKATGAVDLTKVVTPTASQTLTNKTLTAPVLGGTVTGTYTLGGTPTVTAPVITTPTLTLADATTMTTDGGILYDRTNEKLLIGDGTNTQAIQTGTWTAYTPTLSGITEGNGTKSFYYAQIGKIVFVRGSFVFGSTSSSGAAITLTLPVTAVSDVVGGCIDSVRFLDGGTQSYSGIGYFNSTTRMDLFAIATNSSLASWSAAGVSTPMAWGDTDGFYVNFTYQAA